MDMLGHTRRNSLLRRGIRLPSLRILLPARQRQTPSPNRSARSLPPSLHHPHPLRLSHPLSHTTRNPLPREREREQSRSRRRLWRAWRGGLPSSRGSCVRGRRPRTVAAAGRIMHPRRTARRIRGHPRSLMLSPHSHPPRTRIPARPTLRRFLLRSPPPLPPRQASLSPPHPRPTPPNHSLPAHTRTPTHPSNSPLPAVAPPLEPVAPSRRSLPPPQQGSKISRGGARRRVTFALPCPRHSRGGRRLPRVRCRV